jgi:hypothetical protein
MNRFQKTIEWLLEKKDPGVRYLALRDIKHLNEADQELIAARKAAHTAGPIATILDSMQPESYWVEPGPGYKNKYRSSVWSVITLAQLGARMEEDKRLALACNYLIKNSLTRYGQFSMSGAPSGTIDCLQGNVCWALITLGCRDSRLERAFDWMARSVTGEGIAVLEDKKAEIRYYAGKCGPNFACGANYKLPCAWGAVKVMLGLNVCPDEWITPTTKKAIKTGKDFLLGVDPATADYPSGETGKPSQSWWKLGFPVFYVTDVLQIGEALSALGCGNDPRLKNLIDLILKKQAENARWKMEYDLAGKTWVDYGPKKQPNKWVTLRVLRLLDQNQALL